MLYIGIDVAKRSHVAAAMNDGEGIVVEPFEFRNTRKGLERLLHTLAKRGVSPEGSLVGMEATGHYWVALFDFLTANGFEVAVVNPIQTDAWRKVDTVRPAKTDGIDALPIADLLRCKRFEPSALGNEASVGREPRQPRAPLQARIAAPQVGAHAGGGMRTPLRSVLRRLLCAQDVPGETPLCRTQRGGPQARQRLPRPHEGGQGLVTQSAGRAPPRPPLAERVTVRVLYPISGSQVSYQKSRFYP